MLRIANSWSACDVFSPSALRTVAASLATVPRTWFLFDARVLALAVTLPLIGWAAFTEISKASPLRSIALDKTTARPCFIAT